MTVKLSGIVVQKAFGKGSKNEHQAIYIETDKGDFVLRKVGDNPFENKAIVNLVGQRVEVKGTIKDYLFLADEIRVL
ncbi:MAG: hypothetical protein ABJA70_21015 [Chryseolinea sp.]